MRDPLAKEKKIKKETSPVK